VAASSRDEGGLFDERREEQLQLWRTRERGPRGRILVETPVERSGRADLDSIATHWRSLLEERIRIENVADLIPRDSVEIIERAVAQTGFTSSAGKLLRANASLSFMSVVTSAGDSVQVRVTVQRMRSSSSKLDKEWSAEWRKRYGFPPQPREASQEPRPVLETHPFAAVKAHRDSVAAPLRLMARDLVRALDEMRSCDSKDHVELWSLPYCWRSNNSMTVVKGYSKSPGAQPRYDRRPR